MSKRPWYKRYGADFISGTLGLSLEEKGAYSIILDLIYDRGAPIPDDARYIAGVCNCSIRKWSAIRDRLVSLGKISIEGGLISNIRAEKELEISTKSSEERAESGSKGGRKRAENERAFNKNNDLDQAELKHTRAVQKPEEDISSLRSDIARDSAPDPKPEAKPPKPTARSILSGLLDDEHVKAVVEHRQRKRAPLTERAARLMANQLSLVRERGGDPNAAADMMIFRGWTAIEADWFFRDRGRDRGFDARPSSVSPQPTIDWPKALEVYQKYRSWHASWGPKPDEHGCRCPPELLAEFGFRRAA